MTVPSRTTRDLRQGNRQSILQGAYFAPAISRLALSQATGLSPATVTKVVSDLLDEGILLETGVEESQGGRPRTILKVNPSFGYFIGVDVGETHTTLELFDLTLRKLAGLTHPLQPQEWQSEHVIQHIAGGIPRLVSDSGIGAAKILGVGIGVPGIVAQGREVVVAGPGWGRQAVPLLDRLRQQIDLPLYLDNGAKAMAQAELWFGAGRDTANLAVLLIGTGVGAGVIANGQIYRGAINSAGELGHSKIALNGQACRCGGHGCLEAYVGAAGIARRYHELSPAAGGQAPAPAADQRAAIGAIVAAARQGDAAAAQVLQETADYIGLGVANLINLFNPQKVILGGWVCEQLGLPILAPVRAAAERNALAQPFRAATIAMSQFGQDAVCMGAATLALAHFLDRARAAAPGNHPSA